MKKIIDLYKVTSDLSYSTFSQFNSLISGASPFDNYDDVDYYLAHSSDKFLSKFVYNVMKVNNIDDIADLTAQDLNLIFNTIGSKFANKWNRLYQALVVTEYEPDENYNMVEIMSSNGGFSTETATQILNQIVKNKFNQTETDHIDETVTERKDETKDIDNSMFAFNSNSPVPTTSGTETLSTGSTGNQTNTATGSSGNRHVLTTTGDGNTVETQTVGDGNVNTVTREQTPYKLTRSGNIGVTTNQQMITQEIELRENLFKEIVYRDVDSMLTSKIYFY